LFGQAGVIRAKSLIIIGCVLLVLVAGGILSTPVLRRYQVEGQFSLGNRYLEEGDFAQALKAFGKVIDKDNSRIDAMLGKAQSLIGLDRQEEAETVLLEVIRLEPTTSAAYVKLIQIYIQNEDIVGAMDMIFKGEEAAGHKDFEDLWQILDNKISIIADSQELSAGQKTRIRLLCSIGGSQLVLAPVWSQDSNTANMNHKSDGSIEISSNKAGEVKVTAVIGPISRELTLTYFSTEWKAALADFIRKSSYHDAIPAFSNPNELNNGHLIVYLFSWILRSGDDIWEASAAEMEQAAKEIFGPNIKDLVHESYFWVEWDPDKHQYDVIPMGLEYSLLSYCTSFEDKGNEYVVDVVHLYVKMGANNEEQLDVFDEDAQHVGTYWYYEDLNEIFDEDALSQLLTRRYRFTKGQDGGFYLAKSTIIR